MSRLRLDQAVVSAGLVNSRAQAESYIKLGMVRVDGKTILKPEFTVHPDSRLSLTQTQQYVSRAALKLASVSDQLGLSFNHKLVLDVGSSTGGFTDYALKHGARAVIAVDIGTNQLHPSLRSDVRIELHEKTDIRDLKLQVIPDIILADVSFISLRQILPSVAKLSDARTQIVAMVKPQFEAVAKDLNRGVIKNDTIRRQIFKDFEAWIKNQFVLQAKADSGVAGDKGNKERFYLLRRA